MIKILFFIPSLSKGGAEKVLCNLVNNMDQNEFEITIQTIYKCDYKKFLNKGIRYKSILNFKSDILNKLYFFWYRVCAELRLAYSFFIKDDYDIEIAYLECGATKVISQSTNKKAIKLAWVHCDLSKKENMDQRVEKTKRQYQKFNQVICVSKDVEKGFHRLYGDKLNTKVIYNVIDDTEIINKSKKELDMNLFKNNEIQLLALGRLTKQKNFAYLIDTCAKLSRDNYSFHLNILGEGPERNNLEKQIKELNILDKVSLRGFISNPYPWIKKCDLIVCSSKYEGISTVLQEAFILGKPIVTVPCTGMAELLGNSEYGLIVENSLDGLYIGLKKLLDDKGLLGRYADLSKQRSKSFAKEKIVLETETLFKSLYGGNV